MIGARLICAYSKTQSVVAKSSGELELFGIIRASTESLGIATLLGDFSVKDAAVSIGIDATAAMGMAQRVGLNNVRHVEVDVLWIQEQQARKLCPLRKIPGPRNPSDLCTKDVPAALVEQYLQQISVRVEVGRAAVDQRLHSVAKLGPVIASPEVGVLLTGEIGGRGGSGVIAPQGVPQGVLIRSARFWAAPGSPRKKKQDKRSRPEERCVD